MKTSSDMYQLEEIKNVHAVFWKRRKTARANKASLYACVVDFGSQPVINKLRVMYVHGCILNSRSISAYCSEHLIDAFVVVQRVRCTRFIKVGMTARS